MAENKETAQKNLGEKNGLGDENGECLPSLSTGSIEAEDVKKRRTRTPSPNPPNNGHSQFTVPGELGKYIIILFLGRFFYGYCNILKPQN